MLNDFQWLIQWNQNISAWIQSSLEWLQSNPGTPWLLVLGLAISGLVLLAVHWLVALTRDMPKASLRQSGVTCNLPWIWRLARLPSHVLGWLVGPWCPMPWRKKIIRMLLRADLEHGLNVDEVIGGAICLGLLLASFVVLIGFWFGAVSLLAVVSGGLAGCAAVFGWLGGRARLRQQQVRRDLPFILDLLVLAIEGGASLNHALMLASDRGPTGALAQELGRVRSDLQAGRTRAESLQAMADRLELSCVSGWVSSMVMADRQGGNLGPVLRAQSDQARRDRFERAEEMAMKAPVKMLFPLLFCIFPCTFLIIFFPILIKILSDGPF